LSYAKKSPVVHADATYKLVYEGLPVIIVGTSDKICCCWLKDKNSMNENWLIDIKSGYFHRYFDKVCRFLQWPVSDNSDPDSSEILILFFNVWPPFILLPPSSN